MEPLEPILVPWAHRSRVNIPGRHGDWLAHTSCTQIPTDLTVGARKRKVNKAARTDRRISGTLAYPHFWTSVGR